MKYEFKTNGKVVDLETFYKRLMDLSFAFVGDLEEKLHELLDTGSFEHHYETFSIEVSS